MSVVQTLDTTNELLEKFDGAHNKIAITSKLSETCDDLGNHTASLMNAHDQLANYCSESVTKMDQLIKTASTIMREDSWNSKKRHAVTPDQGPVSKRRPTGGVSLVVRDLRDPDTAPRSPANKRPGWRAATNQRAGSPEAREDWESSEVRQPTVKVRQMQVSPEQRADLLRDKEPPVTQESELMDEFASPEKM